MKKIILISSIIIISVIIGIITISNMDNKEKNIISNAEKDKQVINSNMITMMYETDAGTGEYVETKDNTWPESGYIFNDTLSGCENGGELEYNSENNTVNLFSNKSDKCYVYFDKYDGVWIDNVSITNVTGSSVTLSVSATSENGSITKYYYSLNDSEYQEVTSSVIIISDLNKLTEYKISIYCLDNANAKSNIYEISVSTTDISVPVINSVEVSNITDSGFTLTVNATSDIELKRYYFYVNETGENIAGTSTTNSYSFTTLNDNTNYNVLTFVEDDNGIYSDQYSVNIKTDEKKPLLADYIKGLYTSQGTNGLYYHTSSLANSAKDNSYRYAGANPNNYVCFGSDAATCPNNNLYRIIGIFGNETKLIKATSYGKYTWDSDGGIQWNTSDIKNVLNNSYLNSLSSTWQNKITNHIYYVGGYSTIDATSRLFYNAESSGTTWTGKIGLMYVSDFGFAASNNYWTTDLINYDGGASSNDWLFLGSDEWTITPSLEYNGTLGNIYIILNFSGGYVAYSASEKSNVARPAFYLNSDVQYVSGTGSQSDPFRIK